MLHSVVAAEDSMQYFHIVLVGRGRILGGHQLSGRAAPVAPGIWRQQCHT